MNRTFQLLAVCGVSTLLLAGCDKEKDKEKAKTAVTGQPAVVAKATGQKSAVAMIGPSKAAATQPANSSVTGTVTFTPTADGVKVVADLTGLSPGKHGIHLHEKTDMSDPALKSAGGHWNPDMHHHGGPTGAMDMHHAGDLGNIEADANGKAHLDITLAGLTIGDAGKHDVVDHSVVIHAQEDDMKTNPAGNSGDRIAGGAIEAK